MKIKIKHRYTNTVLCAFDAIDLRDAIQQAVTESADLRGADLYGANLYGANLRGADLYGANLRGADLYGANLRGADLRGANLYGANLRGADLYGADLYGADLRGADLRGEKIAIAPILIGGLNWCITISESYLEVGCQRHKHEEWVKFDDKTIGEMHSDALPFWKHHGKWLLASCKAHRAQSLAYRKANPEPVAEEVQK